MRKHDKNASVYFYHAVDLYASQSNLRFRASYTPANAEFIFKEKIN